MTSRRYRNSERRYLVGLRVPDFSVWSGDNIQFACQNPLSLDLGRFKLRGESGLSPSGRWKAEAEFRRPRQRLAARAGILLGLLNDLNENGLLLRQRNVFQFRVDLGLQFGALFEPGAQGGLASG